MCTTFAQHADAIRAIWLVCYFTENSLNTLWTLLLWLKFVCSVCIQYNTWKQKSFAAHLLLCTECKLKNKKKKWGRPGNVSYFDPLMGLIVSAGKGRV